MQFKRVDTDLQSGHSHQCLYWVVKNNPCNCFHSFLAVGAWIWVQMHLCHNPMKYHWLQSIRKGWRGDLASEGTCCISLVTLVSPWTPCKVQIQLYRVILWPPHTFVDWLIGYLIFFLFFFLKKEGWRYSTDTRHIRFVWPYCQDWPRTLAVR